MKLYYAPGTCVLAPHIALEWTEQPYEVELAELGSDEYLKINPLGMAPALKDGNYRIVTQADAILNKTLSRHTYDEEDILISAVLNDYA